MVAIDRREGSEGSSPGVALVLPAATDRSRERFRKKARIVLGAFGLDRVPTRWSGTWTP
jgi:hypothetical protein